MAYIYKFIVLAFLTILTFSSSALLVPRAAMAGEGVMKHNAKKPTKSATPKMALKTFGPGLVILPVDLTPAQLHNVLKSGGLVSAKLNDYWRGDTTGVKDALMSDHECEWPGRRGVYEGRLHAPVIWNDFNYRPEVVEAREKDRYTQKYQNAELACQSAGSVKRWDPYTSIPSVRPTSRDDEKVFVGGDCVPAKDNLPAVFRAGEAVWVMPLPH